MERIMELIASGRAMEKIMQVLITTIPAFAVGVVLVAGCYLTMKSFRKKGQEEKAAKLKSSVPWLYFGFVVVLWMSHNGLLPARAVDFSFAMTPAHLFYFVADLGVFLILGFLFGRIKEKPVTYLVFCVITAVALELVQYVCLFGTLSAVQLTGMVLGSAIGVFVGDVARKKAERKAADQTV